MGDTAGGAWGITSNSWYSGTSGNPGPGVPGIDTDASLASTNDTTEADGESTGGDIGYIGVMGIAGAKGSSSSRYDDGDTRPGPLKSADAVAIASASREGGALTNSWSNEAEVGEFRGVDGPLPFA